MKIVLATKSPARRKLMKELDISFICDVSGYDEDMSAYSDPARLAKFLALEKARFIAPKHPSSLIIGADTFVIINGKKIGKPVDHEDARHIIKSMSGHHIEVHSGVALVKTNSHGKPTKEATEHAVTKIHFAKIPDEKIEEIIAHDRVLEISGAFSIEGMGGRFVKQIEGDYNNVIGLPLFHLDKMLRDFKAY